MDGVKGLFKWINEKNLFTSASKRITNPKTKRSSGLPLDELSKKEKKSLFTKTSEKMNKLKNESTKCIAASHISTQICKLKNYKKDRERDITKSRQHESFKNREILLEKACNGTLKNKPIGQDNPIQDAIMKETYWSDNELCGQDVIDSLHELQKEIDEKARLSAPQSESVTKLIEENRRRADELHNPNFKKNKSSDDILEAEEELVFGGYVRKRKKTRKRKRKTKRKRKRETRKRY